ncbi:hypothetical protein CC86DRAFT_351960 [Ophiobolus disseminans]|uniref:2EXR domain-containing protein n=1 Tax=Ophiobolus disseminans TaxID=1469910 RepID=A0A6A6ZZE1_9PLEO|nr:hypothetical protein CC86DRAFT_351960 [Ophiobolus disseminans]
MSQTTATEQCFASGRYSKRKRTQVTYFMDELDVSDTESDFEDGVQAKKRKPATPKRLPKSKIFPFMELPAEIRCMIYTYALSDPTGINLVATFKNRRRTVERISAEAQAGIKDTRRYYSANRINEDIRTNYADPVSLSPCLLAVSKQIHQEGRDVLYANDFAFTDSFALYSFMLNIGPTAARNLKSLRLMGWGYGRGMKAYNHSCFAVLAWATNLDKLTIDTTPGYSSNPKGAAEQLYRDAFPWLEAMGSAKGKVDAALDVLELPESALENYHAIPGQRPANEAKQNIESFRAALRNLLAQQQKRVMAKPSKKRKVLKNGVTDEL